MTKSLFQRNKDLVKPYVTIILSEIRAFQTTLEWDCPNTVAEHFLRLIRLSVPEASAALRAEYESTTGAIGLPSGLRAPTLTPTQTSPGKAPVNTVTSLSGSNRNIGRDRTAVRNVLRVENRILTIDTVVPEADDGSGLL